VLDWLIGATPRGLGRDDRAIRARPSVGKSGRFLAPSSVTI